MQRLIPLLLERERDLFLIRHWNVKDKFTFKLTDKDLSDLN